MKVKETVLSPPKIQQLSSHIEEEEADMMTGKSLQISKGSRGPSLSLNSGEHDLEDHGNDPLPQTDLHRGETCHLEEIYHQDQKKDEVRVRVE